MIDYRIRIRYANESGFTHAYYLDLKYACMKPGSFAIYQIRGCMIWLSVGNNFSIDKFSHFYQLSTQVFLKTCTIHTFEFNIQNIVFRSGSTRPWACAHRTYHPTPGASDLVLRCGDCILHSHHASFIGHTSDTGSKCSFSFRLAKWTMRISYKFVQHSLMETPRKPFNLKAS